MSTLKVRYTTLKTLANNCFDFDELARWMDDFDNVTRINKEMDCIEIIDIESGDIVDYAHPIVITYKGQRYHDVMFGEMESNWDLDGKNFNTIFDDIETINYPTIVRKALHK